MMDDKDKGKKGVLLRLTDPRYEKLRKISSARTHLEGKHISMQRVMDELLDAAPIPEPSQQSS